MPSWDNTPDGVMTAVVLSNVGGDPDNAFTVDKNYPKPTLPSQSWVLCKVHAAGLTRCDLRARIGEKLHPLEFSMFIDEYHPDSPNIIGEEFVGEIEVAGTDSGFQKGERVAGFIYGGGKAFDGSYAQYTICPKERCWRLGPNAHRVPWEVLAAVPMSAWTAYGALNAGSVKANDVVFIHGAASAVGTWAILLAKERGCKVIASTRQQSKVDKLKDIGADRVVLEEDLLKNPEIRDPAPPDMVLELVGFTSLLRNKFWGLVPRGIAVQVGVLNLEWTVKDFDPGMMPISRLLTNYTLLDDEIPETRKVLIELVDKIADGTIPAESFLDKAYNLEDVGEAHKRMEQNAAVGKLTLKVHH